MNERILQLARQAQNNGDSIHYFDPVFAEKFAELIVKECASFVESARVVGVFNKEPEMLPYYIEEYFGVQE